VLLYGSDPSDPTDDTDTPAETGPIGGVEPDDDEGLLGGHFDLDTSLELSAWSSGDTDGHEHEYDNKYSTRTIDFFALVSDKLTPLPDAVEVDQPFKLLIVNADLSTGGRLTVNGTYDGRARTSWEAVDDYDDTALADLPVYSLDGSGSTTLLSSLQLSFHELSIPAGGLLNTETGCVRDNDPGAAGEWRNGALTLQAVAVNADGSDAFATDTTISAGGVKGGATSGLLWESTVFWHWNGGDCYGETGWYRP
jgi:hypothetical protein